MKMYSFNITWVFLIILSISCRAQYTEPTPVMGQKVCKVFLKTHMDYPENDLQSKTQGTVKIEFTTDNDGSIINYKVVQNISPALDSSAISLFKLILWNPATSLGKPVIGSSEFEVKYNVKSFNKLSNRRGYKHIILPFTPIDTSGTIYQSKQLDTIPIAILLPEFRTLTSQIYSQLTYPEAASKLGLTGEVELMFIIETNGLPSNIIVEKYLGGGCSEEAIDNVKTIKWIPGIKNNQAIRTLYRISINFKKGENKDSHIPSQQGSGI